MSRLFYEVSKRREMAGGIKCLSFLFAFLWFSFPLKSFFNFFLSTFPFSYARDIIARRRRHELFGISQGCVWSWPHLFFFLRTLPVRHDIMDVGIFFPSCGYKFSPRIHVSYTLV